MKKTFAEIYDSLPPFALVYAEFVRAEQRRQVRIAIGRICGCGTCQCCEDYNAEKRRQIEVALMGLPNLPKRMHDETITAVEQQLGGSK